MAYKHPDCEKTLDFRQFDKTFPENFVDFFGILDIIIKDMDTKKDCNCAALSAIPDLSGCRVVVGARQLRKALLSGRAKRVYLAMNADPALTEPIGDLCRQMNIPYFWVRSMAELGSACGIDVGAAAAAVVN